MQCNRKITIQNKYSRLVYICFLFIFLSVFWVVIVVCFQFRNFDIFLSFTYIYTTINKTFRIRVVNNNTWLNIHTHTKAMRTLAFKKSFFFHMAVWFTFHAFYIYCAFMTILLRLGLLDRLKVSKVLSFIKTIVCFASAGPLKRV